MPDFRTIVRAAFSLTAAALFLAGAAAAQYRPDDRYGSREARNIPGEFDYYTLVLSWSPTYCASEQSEGADLQCNRRDGRRYAFVLHGLWPQYERGYPQSCRTRRRPWVPQPVIDGMLDVMPSPKLVINEYRKHGTCSGLEPARYFELARRLFSTVKIPERFINPFEAQFVSPDDLVDEFTSLNPKIKPDGIAIACGGAGNRLREVRICLTKEGEPRSCGQNENQARLCRAQRMYVPPVRSSSRDGDRPAEPGAPPLPRPRLIPSPGTL